MRNSLILLLLFSFLCSPGLSQEICDNGFDDDFDGLIDLNDPDCDCELLVPSSLIPNPSFEEKTCCPTQNAQLECAVSWIQASAPTTDYVHTCANYLGNTNIPAFAPLPFPDGEGGVGFRDGQQHVGPAYKEYVGACLIEPMEAGTTYRLDFYVGFRDNVAGSMNLDIAIFGSTACNNLPFGGNSNTFGCPLNTGQYSLLGQQKVSGSNEWVNVVFEFTADRPYEVLILGPACPTNPNYTLDPYFYLDRLAFAESSEFGTPFEHVEGSICENNLVLSVEDNPEYSYQWYWNGIALNGETSHSILLSPDRHQEGIYQVRITTENGCYLSKKYDLRIPPYSETIRDTICSNETYPLGSENLNSSGYYEWLIEAMDGCDSLIQLFLEVLPTSEAFMHDTICTGEKYLFYDVEASDPGDYATTLSNHAGCDSTIHVNLTVIPPGNQVSLPQDFDIDLGTSIDILPSYIDPNYSAIYWTSEEDSILATTPNLFDLTILQSAHVYFHATDPYGCPVRDSVFVSVRKSNYTLYLPNVFTPNGDHLNDRFNFKTPVSVKDIERFMVFDRWGNLLYLEQYPDFQSDNWGWDGTFRGQTVQPGVYTYVVDVLFIDGFTKIFSGDVTLIN